MKKFKDIFKEAENKIAGIAAAPGIVIGKVYLFTKEKVEISKAAITDIDEAQKNLREALKQSKKELDKIFGIAREKMDEVRAAIFEAQLMILEDPILISNIEQRIQKVEDVGLRRRASDTDKMKEAVEKIENILDEKPVEVTEKVKSVIPKTASAKSKPKEMGTFDDFLLGKTKLEIGKS